MRSVIAILLHILCRCRYSFHSYRLVCYSKGGSYGHFTVYTCLYHKWSPKLQITFELDLIFVYNEEKYCIYTYVCFRNSKVKYYLYIYGFNSKERQDLWNLISKTGIWDLQIHWPFSFFMKCRTIFVYLLH